MCHNYNSDLNNVTGIPADNSSSTEVIEEEPLWKEIIDTSQLVMTCFGIVANVGTIITLIFNGKEFSPAICFLLKHQSFIDALVCLFTAILMVAEPLWVPGEISEYLCFPAEILNDVNVSVESITLQKLYSQMDQNTEIMYI